MPSTAAKLRGRILSGTLGICLLLGASAPAAGAGELTEVTTFKAVKIENRVLVFRVSGLVEQEIEQARLVVRRSDGSLWRTDIAARRVRDAALARGSTLRVSVRAAPVAGTLRVRGKKRMPDTTINSGPSGQIDQTTAAFGFSSSETGSSFRCRLDGQSFASCSSPRTYSSLSEGPHTFHVAAIDAAGNADPSPATRSFSVALAPPPDECEWGTFNELNLPGACWRPYSDQSPFNQGMPASPPLVSNSSAIVNRTVTFGTGGPQFTGGIADTSADFDHPLYYSQATDPHYTIHCRKWVSSCDVEGAQVRIPASARPAGGSDAHLTVFDQAAGWEYDLWETEPLAPGGGNLYVGHGGMTRIGTADADGLGSNATAAHFGLAAGVIRPEELAAGQINHALFMVVKCTNGTHVWPAEGPGVGRTCSSMGLSNTDAPALGQHFYLDMSAAQIDALAAPAWKKTILRAMARYGMFVGDTGASTSGWTIVVQSSSTYTSFGADDPWVTLANQYGLSAWHQSDIDRDVYVFDLRNAVDWASRLRVAAPG
jgi:hypothetical protein